MQTAIRQSMELTVVVEIPKGGFLKRGLTEAVDFFSPFPCPFNYGAVHEFRGGDNDYLDAVVLGKRIARGRQVRVRVMGAVGFVDQGITDDKLICGNRPVGRVQRRLILLFFQFYALCKRWLNRSRGRFGTTRCEGWKEAAKVTCRSVPPSPFTPPPT